MTEKTFVDITFKGQTAWLTLDRPEKLNAVHPPMREQLLKAIDACRSDPQVRAVVITGAGRAFCTGADISGRHFPYPVEGSEGNALHDRTSNLRWGWHTIIEMLWECEKPVIAAVNGWAVGFGCQLALYCDLVIASEEARFVEIFAARGLPMEAGGSYLLPRTLSIVQAKEIAFFAEPIGAQQALSLGLVNRVVPPEDLLPLAEEWSQKLANGPTRVYGMHKRQLQMALDATLQRSFQDEANALALLAGSADAKEALEAFLQKRAPRFTGE